jgi:tetratricopeptide (TPR) repeat protein
MAWFCPQEKGFIDSRWALFNQAARDYVQMRKCIFEPQENSSARRFSVLLDEYQIDHLLLYDPDGERTTRILRHLLEDEQKWELVALEGSAALFGRRANVRSPWTSFDPRWAAYHPESKALTIGPRAPKPPEIWDAFYRTREARNPDRAEAALLILCYDKLHGKYTTDAIRRWRLVQASALVGAGGRGDISGALTEIPMRSGLSFFPADQSDRSGRMEASGSGPANELISTNRLLPDVSDALAKVFMSPQDRGPMEWLVLAVRAARRAISSDPDDGVAYFVLADAYLRLDRYLGEQGWFNALPEYAQLRHTQLVTALEQASVLRPDLDAPHALLAQIYASEGKLDCTLDHLRARLRIAEAEAKKRGAAAENAAERQRMLQAGVKSVEAQVRRAQEIYEANTRGHSDPSAVFARAEVALRQGLWRQALDMLEASNFQTFGKDGALLQLRLMLGVGRAFEIRDGLEPGQEAVLGFEDYHFLRAQATAACGDYTAADAELSQLSTALRQVEIGPKFSVPVRAAIAIRAAEVALALPAGADPIQLTTAGFWQHYYLRILPVARLAAQLRQEADLHVLRGMLRLEAGDIETARGEFRIALEIWGSEGQARAGSGMDFFARPIAQELLRRLEAQRQKSEARMQK